MFSSSLLSMVGWTSLASMGNAPGAIITRDSEYFAFQLSTDIPYGDRLAGEQTRPGSASLEMGPNSSNVAMSDRAAFFLYSNPASRFSSPASRQGR